MTQSIFFNIDCFRQVCKGLLDEIPGQPGYIVAVKTLHTSMDVNPDAILHEAALMAQFDNAYVVRLIGVVTLGDPLLVVLEYCEHGSLNKYLESNDLIPKTKHMISADCAEGLLANVKLRVGWLTRFQVFNTWRSTILCIETLLHAMCC